MKKIELKCFLIFLLLTLIIPAACTLAEDIATQFIKICSMQNSSSYCECALHAYSKDSRERRKADLKKQIDRAEKLRELILTDPGMTEERLNAVLKLQKSSLDYGDLATKASQAGDRAKRKELMAKYNDLQKQKVALVESYKIVNGRIKGKLLHPHSSHLSPLCNLDRTKKELAEIDETSFPGAQREIKNFNKNHHTYKAILGYGHKADCSK